MKKVAIVVMVLVFSITGITSYTQAPPGFPFQSVLKDYNGNLAKNTHAFIRCQLLRSSASGSVVYEEVHPIKTNGEGIFSMIIGQGIKVAGVNSIYGIEWGSNIYFLNIKSAIPPNNLVQWSDPSLTYNDIGTTQLWSVPYALHAGNSNQTNLQTGNLVSTTDLIKLNGTKTASNVIVGSNDIALSLTPGGANTVLHTDEGGNVSWRELKEARIVSGVLKQISLGYTASGDSVIPENSIVTAIIAMPDAKLGDPVFATIMEDVIGFGVYSAFISKDGEIVIRFNNHQDTPAIITGKKLSILLIK